MEKGTIPKKPEGEAGIIVTPSCGDLNIRAYPFTNPPDLNGGPDAGLGSKRGALGGNHKTKLIITTTHRPRYAKRPSQDYKKNTWGKG